MTFGATFGRVFSPTFHPKSQVVGGGFLPTDITGCLLWYDFSDADTLFTDAGSTKVANDGDLIYRANDKSGNNKHVEQPTEADRPSYKKSVKNGLSSILMPGTLEGRLYNSTFYSQSLPVTIIFFITTTNTNGVHFDFGKNVWSFRLNTSIYNGAYLNSGGTFSGNLVTCIVNTTTQFYINGVTKNSGNAGTFSGYRQSIGNRYPGETSPTYGYYHELLVYNSALSDTDRGKVETYLNNKWAIY